MVFDFSKEYSAMMLAWTSIMLSVGLLFLTAVLSSLYGFIVGFSRGTSFAVKSGMQIVLIVVSIFTIGLFLYQGYIFTNSNRMVPIQSLWSPTNILTYGSWMTLATLGNIAVGFLALFLTGIIVNLSKSIFSHKTKK